MNNTCWLYFFLFQYTLSQIEMYLGVAKPILAQNQIDQVLYRFITNTIKIQNEYILSVQPKHAPNSKTHVKNKIRPLELKSPWDIFCASISWWNSAVPVYPERSFSQTEKGLFFVHRHCLMVRLSVGHNETMTKILKEHLQRAIQKTCDLWDIWSEW